jgi:uroporphyrinogen-III synthase
MILITRPFTESQKTASKLAVLNKSYKIFPFIKIHFNEATSYLDFTSFNYLLLTSQNAAKFLIKIAITLRHLLDIKILTLGEIIPNTLKKAGFKNVVSLSEDSVGFYRSLSNQYTNNRLLFLSGNHIANEALFETYKAKLNITREVVYTSTMIESVPTDLLNDVKQILFYSPRSAKAFFQFYTNLPHPIDAICISKAVANELNYINFQNILIAAKPNEAEMLKLI